MPEHPSEIVGVSSTHEYGPCVEVRFTQDALEETIAQIFGWADDNDHTATLYEASTPGGDGERVIVMARDPEGELASWKDKLD